MYVHKLISVAHYDYFVKIDQFLLYTSQLIICLFDNTNIYKRRTKKIQLLFIFTVSCNSIFFLNQ